MKKICLLLTVLLLIGVFAGCNGESIKKDTDTSITESSEMLESSSGVSSTSPEYNSSAEDKEELSSGEPENKGNVLDEEYSEKLTEEIEASFGGAGNPDWATSWYPNIVKIEVYRAGDDYYSVITVTDSTDDEDAKRICMSVLRSSTEPELDLVMVNTESGKWLYEHTKDIY